MKNYKQIIFDALENVVSEPGYRDLHKMHEVALCHRLAVHLENSGKFTGYLIDCDYDRDGDGDTLKTNPEDCEFRPDIIVHIHGSGESNNLIMIEAKKIPALKGERRRRVRFCVAKYNGGANPSMVAYNHKPNLNCVAGNGKVGSKGKWRTPDGECRPSRQVRQAKGDMTKTKVELI